jgi:voltage-gated potassium channel
MEFTLTFLRLFFWALLLVLPILMFLIAAIVVMGQIVCRIEKWSRFDALYWSFITATTVGYGDIRPLKKVSKALSVLIALIGMMFTGIVIAATLATSSMALEKNIDSSIVEKMKQELEQEQNGVLN